MGMEEVPCLDMEEPHTLLNNNRRVSVDGGDIAKSHEDTACPHKTLWRQKRSTVSLDGAAPYDHAKQRKDCSLILHTIRKQPFLRRNVCTKDFALLDVAAPATFAEEEPTQTSQITGVLLVIVSTLLFSLAAVFVKINNSLPPIETSFLRSVYSVFFGVILTTAVYGQQILPFQKSGTIMAFLIARGLTDFMASSLFYLGCTQLGLGLATVILFTNPFWAAILAKFWLGEPYNFKDFVLACVAFAGVALSAAPSLLGGGTQRVNLWMVLLVMPCSMLQACTYCLIKRIACEVHFMQMTVAYGLCGIIVGSGVMGVGIAAEQPLAKPAALNVLGNISVVALNFLVACFAIGAQVLLNLGCSKIQSTVAALIRTTDIPLALLFQYLFFGQVPKPMEIAGACIVLAACVTLTVLKQLTSNKLEDKIHKAGEGSGDPREPFLHGQRDRM